MAHESTTRDTIPIGDHPSSVSNEQAQTNKESGRQSMTGKVLSAIDLQFLMKTPAPKSLTKKTSQSASRKKTVAAKPTIKRIRDFREPKEPRAKAKKQDNSLPPAPQDEMMDSLIKDATARNRPFHTATLHNSNSQVLCVRDWVDLNVLSVVNDVRHQVVDSPAINEEVIGEESETAPVLLSTSFQCYQELLELSYRRPKIYGRDFPRAMAWVGTQREGQKYDTKDWELQYSPVAEQGALSHLFKQVGIATGQSWTHCLVIRFEHDHETQTPGQQKLGDTHHMRFGPDDRSLSSVIVHFGQPREIQFFKARVRKEHRTCITLDHGDLVYSGVDVNRDSKHGMPPDLDLVQCNLDSFTLFFYQTPVVVTSDTKPKNDTDQ